MRFIQTDESLSLVAPAPILAVFSALKEDLKVSLVLLLALLCLLVPVPAVAAGSLPSFEVRVPSMLESLSDALSCLAAGVLVALLATLCMDPY